MDQAPPASELAGSSALAQNTLVSVNNTGSVDTPAGVVSMYISGTPPSGWLICDGSAISRSTYAVLFAIIGTTYGTGDGSTTFNLPDIRGRVPVGLGTHADVSTLNNNDGQAVANRRPKHRTTITDPGHTHDVYGYSTLGAAGIAQATWQTPGGNPATTDNGTPKVTGITIGSGNANDALDSPSFVVVSFIIKT